MHTGTARVLLVEDNLADARLLQEMLADAGPGAFMVDHAGTVEQALNRLERHGPYQIILLDLDLPDSHGFETVDRVHAQAAHIPIVVLTGNNDEALGGRAVEKGVQDYLVKGQIDARLLRRVIRYASQRKQLEEERLQLLEAERAARAEAERLNRVKDEFLATVSHELRSPLSAIVGWCGLAMKGQPHQVGRALDVIERNASALAQLIEDLLDMSRIVSGKVRLSTRTVDPGEMIRTVADGFQVAADAKQIVLEQQIAPRLQPVQCDPSRVQQVVSNLLSNAIKFTPNKGHIRVRVEQDASRLTIEVQDSGEGVPTDFLPHIFGKFLQADASTTRRHGGLGLGLALVKHIVELHGGTIRAESEGAGRGATFTVVLPVTLPPGTDSDDSRYGRVVEDDEDMLPGGLVVLVVDDDKDLCELIRRVLTESGARVLVAHSTAEAWTTLSADTPDILVSDVSMPGEDGYSLIRRLRAATESFTGLPCIALTALARPEDRERALQAGFDAHISKTAEPSELIRTIQRLVPETAGRRASPPVLQVPLDEPAAAGGTGGRKRHILLAEDNAVIAEYVAVCLEMEGYRVSRAESVTQAVALAGQSPVDLLLSDLRLKDGTGWDLMARLREIRAVPGIMMSGYADMDYRRRAKEAGFQDYLVKPVDDEVLCTRIAKLLDSAS